MLLFTIALSSLIKEWQVILQNLKIQIKDFVGICTIWRENIYLCHLTEFRFALYNYSIYRYDYSYSYRQAHIMYIISEIRKWEIEILKMNPLERHFFFFFFQKAEYFWNLFTDRKSFQNFLSLHQDPKI